jgi:hypothetical protein
MLIWEPSKSPYKRPPPSPWREHLRLKQTAPRPVYGFNTVQIQEDLQTGDAKNTQSSPQICKTYSTEL